eukprot:1314855-Amorphochlora_amoeboformis.AAC.2
MPRPQPRSAERRGDKRSVLKSYPLLSRDGDDRIKSARPKHGQRGDLIGEDGHPREATRGFSPKNFSLSNLIHTISDPPNRSLFHISCYICRFPLPDGLADLQANRNLLRQVLVRMLRPDGEDGSLTWKVLVFDDRCPSRSVSRPAAPKVRKMHGVTVMMKLNDKRERIEDTPAFYLVE